ncbi:hypothetical protein C8Q75DRAFT_761923 [Abortiporus biennis]|nr:hypothetical protein C8Q75DRAFT_761923 [Abortiporus biennis]
MKSSHLSVAAAYVGKDPISLDDDPNGHVAPTDVQGNGDDSSNTLPSNYVPPRSRAQARLGDH